MDVRDGYRADIYQSREVLMDLDRLAEIIRRRSLEHRAGGLAETAAMPPTPGTGSLTNADTLAFYPRLKGALNMAQAPARGFVDEFGRATDAVASAIETPNLPNISEAGIRTLLMSGLPIEAALATGGAYALAAAGDAFGGSARAADPKAVEARLRSMPPDQLKALQREIGVDPDGRLGPATINAAVERERNAERDASNQVAIEAARAKAQAEAQANAQTAQRGEVGRRVDEAKSSLMDDLSAARDPVKDETLVGRLYDQLGVLTPLAAGVAGGSAARIAKPAIKTGKKFVDDYLNPFLVGSESAGAVALAPTFATAHKSDPTNPEYAAWQKYRTRLPAEADSEIARADERLASVPKIDPAVTQAREDLRSPSVRGMAMLQGGLGGLVGNVGMAAMGQVPGKLAQIPGRVARGVKEGFSDPPGLPAPNLPAPLEGRTISQGGTNGRSGLQPKSKASATTSDGDAQPALLEGPSESRPASGTETYRYYKDLPDDARQVSRDAYAADLKVNGDVLPAKPTAARLQDMMLARGHNVPITPQRVKATNEAVTRFLKQFKRPPKTAQEWASILGDKTLAIPLAVGSAAASFGDGEQY